METTHSQLNEEIIPSMVKQSLCVGLQTCISHRWTNDIYSDFTVVVEEVEFQCHRFILASCSTFFSLMFRNEMSETLSNRAVLKNIRKETFSTILNAIYLGEFDLTLDNVEEILYAVHILDMGYLIEDCEEFISNNLDIDNYEQFYHCSKRLNILNLHFSLHAFILNNFEHFVTTKTFLRMSFEDVRGLFRDYNLNVTSENIVIDGILKWVASGLNNSTSEEILCASADEDDGIPKQKKRKIATESVSSSSNNDCVSKPFIRKQYLATLLSAARLRVASEDYLENLLTNPLITTDISALSTVKDALLSIWKRDISIPPLVPYRKCHNLCNVMAFITKKKLMFHILEENRVVKFFSFTDFTYWDLILAGYRDVMIISRSEIGNVYYDIFDNQNREFNCFAMRTRIGRALFFCHQRNIILVSNSSSTLNSVDGSLSSPNALLTVPIHHSHTPKLAVVYKDNIVIFSSVNTNLNNQVLVVKLDKSKTFESVMFPYSTGYLVSFQTQGNTFVLNGNGDLWSISDSELNGATLMHIAKLWDKPYKLKGAACYSRVLLLFGPPSHTNLSLELTSLPNEFERIEFVANNYGKKTVPLIVPRQILSI